MQVSSTSTGPPKQWLAVLMGCAEPVHQVPGGFPRNPQVPMQLHRGHAVQLRGQQADGNRPIRVSQLCALHDSTGLEAELGPVRAVSAPVRHCRMGDIALDAVRPTQCGQYGPSGQICSSSQARAVFSSGKIRISSLRPMPARWLRPGAACAMPFPPPLGFYCNGLSGRRNTKLVLLCIIPKNSNGIAIC